MFTEVKAGRDRLGRVKKNKERYKSYDGLKKGRKFDNFRMLRFKNSLRFILELWKCHRRPKN